MIHIAIVSHGHEELLISSQLGGLAQAGAQMQIWVKDNCPSASLRSYCEQVGVHYTDASPGLGFGANNNFLFQLVRQSADYAADDLFVIMNPDIAITPERIAELEQRMQRDHALSATLNLFKDHAGTIADGNIRIFPDLLSPLRVPLVRSLTSVYDKSKLPESCEIDWCSGAFLAMRAAHFEQLSGFDDDYFMYFEDVDLCYRSYLLTGHGVRYYPDLHAVHFGAHRNRSLASPHARWFLTSFIRFIFRKYCVYPRRPHTLKSL